MDKLFQKYDLKDFYEDVDFCSWVMGKRTDLEGYYTKLLLEYPDKNELFEKARKVIASLEDEKVFVNPSRKLEIWESALFDYRKHQRKQRLLKILKYAAVFVPFVILALGAVYYYFSTVNHPGEFTTAYTRQDLNNTRLILENGQEIKIMEQTSEIVMDKETSSVRINDQQVSLSSEQKARDDFNQLIVPFGKRSKVILSDHTVVWLNAGSRLIYPTRFFKKERIVRLEGEAYLEVAKDKEKPFIVETLHSRIKVLGTSFNVKAYPDEATEETVLAEGSVKLDLHGPSFKKSVLLEPEQRVVFMVENKSCSVSRVDIQDYISWVNGMFIFHNEPMTSVLRRISRHYNIEIRYSQAVENKFIYGKLDLKEDSHKVLDALALISNGNYKDINGILYFSIKN